MAQAVCATISLLEVRHPGTELQSPDQGPTASKEQVQIPTRHLDSQVGALHSSLQPSRGPGTPYPSSLGRAAGEAARGSRSHRRTSVRRGPVASLGMATPLPWPLSTVPPLRVSVPTPRPGGSDSSPEGTSECARPAPGAGACSHSPAWDPISSWACGGDRQGGPEDRAGVPSPTAERREPKAVAGGR